MDAGIDGVHDMGGMHGFGPVVVEEQKPVFHFRWEGKVRGMMQRTLGRYYNLDEFRHAIERMPPGAYLRAATTRSGCMRSKRYSWRRV